LQRVRMENESLRKRIVELEEKLRKYENEQG